MSDVLLVLVLLCGVAVAVLGYFQFERNRGLGLVIFGVGLITILICLAELFDLRTAPSEGFMSSVSTGHEMRD